MPVCGQCGQRNAERAQFCNACGASLRPAASAEVRKTVTVVFCDLVGSTSLGDHMDPEVLRELMSQFHAELRSILESHGGIVEKFVGDAAMAVFGIPRAHEDDAMRALRAASEIRNAVARLGVEVRTGVNTGEVVAAPGETLVTGDAVNVAARLEQTATAGEVLMGEGTHVLAGNGIRAEAVEPLGLKGKAKPDYVSLYGDRPRTAAPRAQRGAHTPFAPSIHYTVTLSAGRILNGHVDPVANRHTVRVVATRPSAIHRTRGPCSGPSELHREAASSSAYGC
jgi:class 3 adenylate cyclase